MHIELFLSAMYVRENHKELYSLATSKFKYTCAWHEPKIEKHLINLKGDHYTTISYNNRKSLPVMAEEFAFELFWMFSRCLSYRKYLTENENKDNQLKIISYITNGLPSIADDLVFPYLKINIEESILNDFINSRNQPHISLPDLNSLWWAWSKSTPFTNNALFCCDSDVNYENC